MAIRERAGSAATPAASTSFPRFESYPYDQSIGLVLRSAFLRASRRTATCKIVPASILRDAVLRTAPQDEVWGIEFHSVRYDRFHGIDALDAEIDGAKVSCGCPLAIMAILPTRFAPLVRFSLVHDAGDVISRVRLVLRRAADRRESPRLTWKEARTLEPCQNRRWRVRAG